MDINATLLGQMITFAFFIWFTMKFVWPPLMNILEERRKKIADGLAAAEKNQNEWVETQGKIKAELNDAKNQASLIVEHANHRANHIVEEAKERARTEGERLLHLAQSEIEQQFNLAKAELVEQISQLALVGAERILGHEINARSNQQLLDELIEGI